MILTEKQIATQEAILKRLYPWVSMEEAKKKELWFWCIVKHSDWEYWKQISKVKFVRKDRDGNRVTTEDILSNDIEIIGLPPTLPRILTALGDEYSYIRWRICRYTIRMCYWPICEQTMIRKSDDHIQYIWICEWEILNEDMTDCNLRQQSQETQDAIYNILCK